jgi:hypothetical protein
MMKKIPLVFVFNHDKKEMTQEINPDAKDAFLHGYATRKYDGTCCHVRLGVFYKRRMVPPHKEPPTDFILEDFDMATGKSFGWVLVTDADKYHWEGMTALCNSLGEGPEDGTYELVGPKVQGNPENEDSHILVPHAEAENYQDVPRDYDGLREWLRPRDIEGLVFHHPDGRMAKIRKKDFGLPRYV